MRDDVEDHEENIVVGLIRIVVSKNNEKTRTAESTRGERYPRIRRVEYLSVVISRQAPNLEPIDC